MSIEKILIVDDELLVRSFLSETLKRKGLDITTAENGTKAFQILKDNIFDLVITDMKMPDFTGIDVLKKVKELSSSTVVVVITAFGSIENAVEAMRLGAFNYLIKPFSPDTIEAIIEKANEHVKLIEENQYLRQQMLPGAKNYDRLVGSSPSMRQIIAEVAQVARSNASVFINGESGTGKEVVAHAIHYQSPRALKPFIKVNCAAIPDSLLESEFFGHEKGAFTGASIKKPGRFELASLGTLLLDEVTEIPLSLQAKLLRVIQEQEFERIGGTKAIKVDVRLISTSNRNIKEALTQKVLREDLFYRLNVVPINLPPLRERKEDIIPLAEYFLQRICQENHRDIKQLNQEAKNKLLNYPWPGNARELANILERAVVMDASKIIAPEHLYLENMMLGKISTNTSAIETKFESFTFPHGMTLQEMEKRLIIETLQAQKNNKTKTAQVLGISLRTLRNKLNEYQLNLSS